jgi:hypothetical protein
LGEGPVADQLAERMLTYRRYRQKVEFAAAGVYWVDDPHLDLTHQHLPLGKRNSMVGTNWYRCNSAAVGGRNG